ncbi:TPA: hypothetical protein ACMDN8_004523 [Vibrio parahaemolyticus]|nr:hypothetical protein [Vibrio parahaemolyticus]
MTKLTHRDFCFALSDAIGHKIKPSHIEQTRRALVREGLLTKSQGKNLAVLTKQEAATILIAICLPGTLAERVDWAARVAAFPGFMNRLAELLDSPSDLSKVEYLSIGDTSAIIGIDGTKPEDFQFGNSSPASYPEGGFVSVSVEISPALFRIASVELINLNNDCGEMVGNDFCGDE